MRIIVAILGGILLSAFAVSTAWAAKDDTLLVSRAAGAKGAGATAGSFAPSISADGKLVAFDSSATNLHPSDPDDFADVFVRDIDKNTLTLVSRASGASGAVGDESSFAAVVSADGRYVVFVTYAGNLNPADGDAPEPRSDVYVRDLKTNTTTLVSRASGAAGAKGDADSYGATISGDGRYVAFVSIADNLQAQDTDDTEDIYLRDLKTNTTSLVTRPVLDLENNQGGSSGPAISADGRYVAFTTSRTDFVAPRTPSESGNDVLVRDMQTGKVELVSRATGPAGGPADDDSGHPSISADGRFVSFHSLAANLATGDDKRFTDVFVRDRGANTTTLVTAIPGVPQSENAAGESFADSISGDGRYVTFNTSAPGLYPNGGHLNQFGDPVVDVFVRDLKDAKTTLVSRASGAAGAYGNDYSSTSVVSGRGRFVAFASIATNLHSDAVGAGSMNEAEEPAGDIFARDVLGPQGDETSDRGGAAPRCPVHGHVITGTEKADVRNGTAKSDVMFGLAGNDVLRGAGGRDCIYGQRGRDRLLGQNATDWLWGGPGADLLDGGRGSDRLRGQDGNDRLKGGSGKDSLTGGDGRDRLSGGPGNDRLRGSEGADRLTGGSSDDVLSGGSGADRLRGDAGDDHLGDHSGRDHLWGGSGNDRIDARDGTRRGRARADVVSCGAGARDVAFVDVADRVAGDCERVVRR